MGMFSFAFEQQASATPMRTTVQGDLRHDLFRWYSATR